MRAFDAPLRRRGLPRRPGPATRRSGAYRDGIATEELSRHGKANTSAHRRGASLKAEGARWEVIRLFSYLSHLPLFFRGDFPARATRTRLNDRLASNSYPYLGYWC